MSSLAGLFVALCMLAVTGPAPAEAGPPPAIVVDTADDLGFPCTPGNCSIRGAIEAANANPGFDTITFKTDVFPPGGGAPTIVLAGTLPGLPLIDAGSGITIDGSGADVRISGEFLIGPWTGFSFHSALGTPAINVTVRDIGLYIFDIGIKVCGGGGDCDSDVTNVDLESVTTALTTNQGILINGDTVSGVSVGTSTIADAGGIGIGIYGTVVSDVFVADNELTDGATHINVGSSTSLSDVSVTDNASQMAGGDAIFLLGSPMERIDITRNVLTDAMSTGIILDREGFATASDVTIADNEIDSPGYGITIRLRGVVQDLDLARNTISGADNWGVWASFHQGTNNVIHDNTLFDNGRDGIEVRSYVAEPHTRVLISHNSTYNNGELGIDLYKPGEAIVPGVTVNDAGDGDAGPNDLLNFPVITGEAGPVITGTACPSCTVELFRSDGDLSGHGEGEMWLKDVTADGTGQFTTSICGVGLVPGDKITATATDTLGNTSEFSLNHTTTVASGPCPTPTPSPTAPATPTATPTVTSTNSPTPTSAPTNTQTSTPTAIPTSTSEPTELWGDSDCSGVISARDNQALLRLVLAQPPLSQTEPCPDLGDSVGGRIWGDWDCNGAISARDNQALLRHVLSQSGLSQTEPCPDIGTTA